MHSVAAKDNGALSKGYAGSALLRAAGSQCSVQASTSPRRALLVRFFAWR